jgi:hypothetical protein
VHFENLRASVIVNPQIGWDVSPPQPEMTAIATWTEGWRDFGDEDRRVRVTGSIWNTPDNRTYTMVDIDLFGRVYSTFLDSVN